MRFGLISRDYYACDLYDVQEDSDGRPVRQTFRETVRLNLDTGQGDSLTIYSDEPLGIGTLVTNIKQRFGGLVYPSSTNSAGQAYRIFSEDPILSPFGTREGFIGRADRVG